MRMACANWTGMRMGGAWGVEATQTGVAGIVWNRRMLAPVPESMRARAIMACEHD